MAPVPQILVSLRRSDGGEQLSADGSELSLENSALAAAFNHRGLAIWEEAVMIRSISSTVTS
jgi:hypothetical protein